MRLTINSNDPDKPIVDVAVTLEVIEPPGPPDIVINAPPLDMVLFPDAIGTIDFSIANVGESDLVWSITEGAAWLSFVPATGVTAAGGSTPVQAIFNSAGLTPGFYELTQVDFSSNDPDQPLITLPASLTVNSVPGQWTQISLPAGCPDWTRFDGEYFPATGLVYFLGGRGGTSGGDTFGNVISFDPATQTCADTGTVMPTPVSNYSIGLVNNGTADLLCLFGGRDTGGAYATLVQCYDPLANSASPVSILPGQLASFIPGGVAVVNNTAYVFSGFRNTVAPYHMSETWAWDPVANSWSQKGDVSLGRGYINTAIVDGLIYGFGGDVFDGTNLVAQTIAEVFDPSTGVWSDAAVADLPEATGEGRAYGFDTTAPYDLAGQIIIAGGGLWPDNTPEAFSYDVASDTYDYTFGDLNVSRRNHAGFFVPGDPGAMWVFGGRSGVDTPPYAPPEYYNVAFVPPPPEPEIDVVAPPLVMTLQPDQTATLDMVIYNLGDADLIWSITDGAVDWLDEVPDAGVTPPAGNSPVSVIFDSTGLLPGVYQTNVTIASNDLDEPEIILPATLMIPESDLAVVKSVSDPVVKVGDLFTYTLEITNNGPDGATAVMLEDILPAEVLFSSASPGCAEDTGVVTCDIGPLNTGESITLFIAVTAVTDGVATNTAEVWSENSDPDPINNSSSVDVTIEPLLHKIFLPIIFKN